MTDTDRIAQMAREAELIEPRDEWDALPKSYTDAITKLIGLVAEDCAKVMRDEFAKMAPAIAQAAQEGESVTNITEMCSAAAAFRVIDRYSN